MTLTCYCGDDDYEWYFYDYEWYFYGYESVQPLKTKRSRRCCSCKALVRPGDDAMEFRRYRNVRYGSIEERIHGDEVPLASWWLCDRCAGLYESLDGLGFCDLLGQDLRAVCKEYAQMQRDAGVFRGQMVVQRSMNEAAATGGSDGR